ncbi:hypothetical protein JD969_07430 [Planctomycetota bacterium]|nr:hypothetical protein JD969_07430 [Planctomycetota bacterium]
MNQINFLPESYMKRLIRRRRIIRELILIIALLFVLLGCWVSGVKKISEKRMEVVQLTRAIDQAVKQEVDLVKLENEMLHLGMQIKLERELSQSVRHTQILAKLSELLPSSVALLEIEMVTKRPEPMTREEAKKKEEAKKTKGRRIVEKTKNEIQENCIEMQFEGIAPDDLVVAEVIASLDECDLFEFIEMRYSREIKHEEVVGRKFKLNMQVDLSCKYLNEQIEGVANAN